MPPPTPTQNQNQQNQNQSQKHYSFVIEIAHKRNWSVLWPLDGRTLRGRWDKENIPTGSAPSPDGPAAPLNEIPNLPGMMIQVMTHKKAARIYDILARPENKTLLEKAQSIHTQVFGGTKAGPEAETQYPNMNENEIKSWLYWCRRLLDNRQAVVRSGEVPSMVVIDQLPGLIQMHNNDMSSDPNLTRLKPVPRNYRAPKHEDDVPDEALFTEESFA